MIKKTIIIIISILVFLGVSLFGLYYFRNPVWLSKYEDPTFEYLDKYLYHYDEDNTLRGVLWMNFISYGDNYLHLQPSNSEDQRVRLPLLSNEFINIDIGSLNASKYPIYLSLSFESKDKNILDEMLCSYIKGEFCIKELELDSWRIYENSFPFPELSLNQSLEILDNTASRYLLSSSDVSCKFRDLMKSGDIAQMVFNNDYNLNPEWNISEWDRSYLFINVMDNKSDGYKVTKSLLCDIFQPLLSGFLGSKDEYSIYDYVDIKTLQKQCDSDLDIEITITSQEDYILDWKSQLSKDLVQSSLYCTLSRFENTDFCVENVNKLLSSGLMTSLNSPINSDDSPLCSKELFYTLKLYVKERLNEKSN